MLDDDTIEVQPQVRVLSVDWKNHGLDLNEFLVKNPEATFFLRFEGNSMEDIGIFEGDIIVVDRSKPMESGNLVIVVVDGIFKMRRLVKQGKSSSFNLRSHDCSFVESEESHSENVEIWGTVSSIIRKL